MQKGSAAPPLSKIHPEPDQEPPVVQKEVQRRRGETAGAGTCQPSPQAVPRHSSSTTATTTTEQQSCQQL